jgi:hypothetical protein
MSGTSLYALLAPYVAVKTPTGYASGRLLDVTDLSGICKV